MATLNTTTADNYLTITVNGTTIKQLWAKKASDGTSVKIYQKWKDGTKIENKTSTQSFYGKARGFNKKVFYSGKQKRSYCQYGIQSYVYKSSTAVGSYGRACVQLTMEGANLGTSGYLYTYQAQNNGGEFSKTYSTIYYASSDSSYYSKTLAWYIYLKTSSGSSTAASYGTDTAREHTSTSARTPSNTYKSSTTTYSSFYSTSSYSAYQGVSVATRVEDN